MLSSTTSHSNTLSFKNLDTSSNLLNSFSQTSLNEFLITFIVSSNVSHTSSMFKYLIALSTSIYQSALNFQ
jgi:hypothetical protein